MQLYQRKITIIAPFEDEPVIIKDNFDNNLHEIISDIVDNRDIVLMGDLNARVRSELYNLVAGPCGEQQIKTYTSTHAPNRPEIFNQ